MTHDSVPEEIWAHKWAYPDGSWGGWSPTKQDRWTDDREQLYVLATLRDKEIAAKDARIAELEQQRDEARRHHDEIALLMYGTGRRDE